MHLCSELVGKFLMTFVLVFTSVTTQDQVAGVAVSLMSAMDAFPGSNDSHPSVNTSQTLTLPSCPHYNLLE